MHKNLRLLIWINFLQSFNLFSALAIIFYAQVAGSYALGISIFSIASIASIVFDIPLGVFSDRGSRKTILVLGVLVYLFEILLYGFANSFTILAIGAILGGLSSALSSGNDDAFLIESLSEEGNQEDYPIYRGKISSMHQLGAGISVLIGAVVATYSIRLAVQLTLVPVILSLIFSLYLKEPTKHTAEKNHFLTDLKEALNSFKNNRRLKLITAGGVAEYSLGETSHMFQSAFYATIMPVWGIGIAKSATYIAGFLGFHCSGRIIKKYKELPSLIFSSIFTRVTNIIAYIFPSILSPVLITSNSLSYGVNVVAKSSIMQKEYTARQRATMGSFNSVADNLAFALLAPILGLFADNMSPASALLIFQLLMIPAIFIFIKMKKK